MPVIEVRARRRPAELQGSHIVMYAGWCTVRILSGEFAFGGQVWTFRWRPD